MDCQTNRWGKCLPHHENKLVYKKVKVSDFHKRLVSEYVIKCYRKHTLWIIPNTEQYRRGQCSTARH